MFKKSIIMSLLLAISIITLNTTSKSNAVQLSAYIGSTTTLLNNIFTAKKVSKRELKKELKQLEELYNEGKIDKASYESGKQQLNFKLEEQEEIELNNDKKLVEDENFEAVDNEGAQDEPVTPEIINELLEETGD